jgi:hypothetical protein
MENVVIGKGSDFVQMVQGCQVPKICNAEFGDKQFQKGQIPAFKKRKRPKLFLKVTILI